MPGIVFTDTNTICSSVYVNMYILYIMYSVYMYTLYIMYNYYKARDKGEQSHYLKLCWGLAQVTIKKS